MDSDTNSLLCQLHEQMNSIDALLNTPSTTTHKPTPPEAAPIDRIVCTVAEPSPRTLPRLDDAIDKGEDDEETAFWKQRIAQLSQPVQLPELARSKPLKQTSSETSQSPRPVVVVTTFQRQNDYAVEDFYVDQTADTEPEPEVDPEVEFWKKKISTLVAEDHNNPGGELPQNHDLSSKHGDHAMSKLRAPEPHPSPVHTILDRKPSSSQQQPVSEETKRTKALGTKTKSAGKANNLWKRFAQLLRVRRKFGNFALTVARY